MASHTYRTIMSCGNCKKLIDGRTDIPPKCVKCRCALHKTCVKPTEAQDGSGMVPTCDNCILTSQEAGASSTNNVDIDTKNSIKLILEQVSTTNINVNNLNTNINNLEAKIDKIGTRMDKFEKFQEETEDKIEKIEDQIEKNEEIVANHTKSLNHHDEYSRRNNILIFGIPYDEKEDLFDHMQKLGNALDIKILPQHIDKIHRLPKRTENPIIMKLVHGWKKEDIIDAYGARYRRTKESLTAHHLGWLNNKESIYINENLPPKLGKLVKETKSALKEKGFSVTARNGKVKAYNKSSKNTYYITLEEDFDLKIQDILEQEEN